MYVDDVYCRYTTILLLFLLYCWLFDAGYFFNVSHGLLVILVRIGYWLLVIFFIVSYFLLFFMYYLLFLARCISILLVIIC